MERESGCLSEDDTQKGTTNEGIASAMMVYLSNGAGGRNRKGVGVDTQARMMFTGERGMEEERRT